MRSTTSVGLTLAVLAALVWGYALLDGPGPDMLLAGSAGTSDAVPAELATHPWADDIVARRVWSGDRVDVLGRPSPDGRHLSYVDWIGGGNLGIRDLRTGESRLLTHKEGGWTTEDHALFSVFSPDGSRLAFQWWNAETAEYEIRVVDLEEGTIRTIYAPGDHQRYMQPVAWSGTHDALLVLHSMPDRTWQIAFMDPRDGGLRVVRSLDWRQVAGIDASPDGAWIAYSLSREDEPAVHDIFLLAADGSDEVQLASSDASEVVVGWLPGGGPLFYLRQTRGATRLVAQALDGSRAVGEPLVVRSDLVNASPMGAFRDGFLFSVAVDARQTRLGTVDLEAGRLTSPLTSVVPSRMERAVAPEWSADGEQLYYVVNPPLGGLSFPVNMAVRSVRTGAERRFATPFGYVLNIAPSPAGDELLVQGYGPEGRNGIYRMPVGGDTVEAVELNGIGADQVRLPQWSADGRAVYYSRWIRDEGDAEVIVERDLETGELRELYATDRLRGFAVSPDGSEMAVTSQDPSSPEESQLLVVDLATGHERELVRVAAPGFRNGTHVTWSPDGAHIVYIQGAPESDGTEVLRVVSREGGEPRIIRTESWVARPRIHPDGRRIAVMAGVNRWEVWTLENVRAVVADR